MQLMVDDILVTAKLSWLPTHEAIINLRAATQWAIGILIKEGHTQGVVDQGGYSIHWKKLS